MMRWSDAGVSGIDAAIEMTVMKMSPCRVLCCRVESCRVASSPAQERDLKKKERLTERDECASVSAPGGRGRFWGVAGQGEGRVVGQVGPDSG